jgi:hypothetical protein
VPDRDQLACGAYQTGPDRNLVYRACFSGCLKGFTHPIFIGHPEILPYPYSGRKIGGCRQPFRIRDGQLEREKWEFDKFAVGKGRLRPLFLNSQTFLSPGGTLYL